MQKTLIILLFPGRVISCKSNLIIQGKIRKEEPLVYSHNIRTAS